jgi:hypothetical protein
VCRMLRNECGGLAISVCEAVGFECDYGEMSWSKCFFECLNVLGGVCLELCSV